MHRIFLVAKCQRVSPKALEDDVDEIESPFIEPREKKNKKGNTTNRKVNHVRRKTASRILYINVLCENCRRDTRNRTFTSTKMLMAPCQWNCAT